MRFRDKLLAQTVICLTIFALVRASAMAGGEWMEQLRSKIGEAAQKNYTIEDVIDGGARLASGIYEAPAALVSLVEKAGEGDEYAAPIDEDTSEEIQAVYAAAGGVVTYAGIDKELGVCIRVDHGDAVSVYGHLHTLIAVTGERVGRGDVIATYNNEGGEDFYYALENT